MAIDLTGGIDPAREQVFASRPDDPEMRDSVSFWVVDDRGAVGLPRIGGPQRDAHRASTPRKASPEHVAAAKPTARCSASRQWC